MKVYTFASLKGGTGKSSTTITAAECCAAAGKKVLVLDMDINNSCSFYFLQDSNESDRRNIAYALQSDNLSDFVIKTKNENINIIPSSLRLVDLRAMSTSILKRLMVTLNNRYDAVFIDTAPTYDNIVLDYVITPINYDQFNFNTSVFLGQKLRLETESFDKWFLFFNGHESRYDSNLESLQNQYQLLFSQHDILGKKLLPVRFPFTRNMRKFADTNELLCSKGQTEKLHNAVCDLCSLLLEEEIRPEKF